MTKIERGGISTSTSSKGTGSTPLRSHRVDSVERQRERKKKCGVNSEFSTDYRVNSAVD